MSFLATRLGRIAVRNKTHGVFRRMCGEPPKPPKVELPPKVEVAQVSPLGARFTFSFGLQLPRNNTTVVRACVCVIVCVCVCVV